MGATQCKPGEASKGAMVMGGLTAKVGSDNTLFGHVMKKHDLDKRNKDGERFEDFFNTNGTRPLGFNCRAASFKTN